MKMCDGGTTCTQGEEHIGPFYVHVIGRDGHDWGNFNYCYEAILYDRKLGMTVTEVKSPPTDVEKEKP